jgi:hypothetical protein
LIKAGSLTQANHFIQVQPEKQRFVPTPEKNLALDKKCWDNLMDFQR